MISYVLKKYSLEGVFVRNSDISVANSIMFLKTGGILDFFSDYSVKCVILSVI